MCGIADCAGIFDAGKLLLDAQKGLEHRGYDSVGMTLIGDGFLTVTIKKVICSLCCYSGIFSPFRFSENGCCASVVHVLFCKRDGPLH